jgi:aspartate-semialdehyde dehydrogenase
MIRVAIVGATGIVGQQCLVCLDGHPWFKVAKLAASERSAGKTYIEALRDPSGSIKWFCPEPIPAGIENLPVENAEDFDATTVDLVLSAVDASAAKVLEPRYAKTTPVVSNASAFRFETDTPILVGGVNMEHAALLKVQQQRRGWKGFVAPKPNCTITGLVVALKPVLDAFGVKRVVATSLQAMSGAGRTPGLSAMDMVDNVVPFIPGEEPKVESEPQKILGALAGDHVESAPFPISATCTRVPVLDGHLVCATVELEREASPDDVKRVMQEFGRDFVALGLPSTPPHLIEVLDDPFRPQPRMDRDRGGGMTTTVGRIRPESVLGQGVRFVCLAHNTKLGAAKGSIQTAEYLVKHFLGWETAEPAGDGKARAAQSAAAIR